MNAFFRFTLKAVGFLTLLTCSHAIAKGAAYVSLNGVDAGTCPGPTPCRTVNYALSQIGSGGIVVILDSGTYAPFTVDTPAQVFTAPGAHAQINVTGNGSGVTINTSGLVVLRGLAIKGGATSINGIGASLGDVANIQIEDCSITGFSRGIFFESRSGTFSIKNTTARDCGSGIYLNGTSEVLPTADPTPPPSAFMRVLIEQCSVEGNNSGVSALNAVWVTIRNSVAAANKRGFRASVNGKVYTAAIMMIENSIAANNDIGVYGNAVIGGATIYVSNSMITSNDKGLVADLGSLIYTRQNNTVASNGPGGSGNLSTYTGQ